MIYQYDKRKKVIGQFHSIQHAAAKTGIGSSKIVENLQGTRKTVNGYIFSGKLL